MESGADPGQFGARGVVLLVAVEPAVRSQKVSGLPAGQHSLPVGAHAQTVTFAAGLEAGLGQKPHDLAEKII
ncbi:hypothetical protein ABZZ17_20605 [Streptomyces sp. NPDC006512]|uniref:hypothetical protein n=1 Tax=Streptomyces sp. NPDC006512 TaxID=3154307 RepID=UPI0033A4B4DC